MQYILRGIEKQCLLKPAGYLLQPYSNWFHRRLYIHLWKGTCKYKDGPAGAWVRLEASIHDGMTRMHPFQYTLLSRE
jgi:hypothetical protein